MLGRLYDATWGRAFAFGYDLFLERAERAGLRDIRRDLVSQARGRTLEIGSGTGLNLEHYPEAVTELVLSEPFPPMAAKLRGKVERSGRVARVVEAAGEDLPLEDASFDTAVLTMVLCTAPDPERVLSEVARVLRPGGRFLFFEHVRSEEPGLARWQDRLAPAWRVFGHGCRCNQDTAAIVARAPLELERDEHGILPGSVPIVRPLYIGVARRAA